MPVRISVCIFQALCLSCSEILQLKRGSCHGFGWNIQYTTMSCIMPELSLYETQGRAAVQKSSGSVRKYFKKKYMYGTCNWIYLYFPMAQSWFKMIALCRILHCKVKSVYTVAIIHLLLASQASVRGLDMLGIWKNKNPSSIWYASKKCLFSPFCQFAICNVFMNIMFTVEPRAHKTQVCG